MEIETKLEIDTFTGEVAPEPGLADGIADLFQRGYPSMYPSDVRAHDLARYRNGGDIVSQICAGNTWMVARNGSGLVGILKYRPEVRRPDCTDPQSLLAWIITDPTACQRGFGKRLIAAYHDNLSSGVGIASPSGYVMSVADVMQSNVPSCRLFSSCGYEVQEGKGPGFLLMSKRVGMTNPL